MKKLLLLLIIAGAASMTNAQWIQTNGPFGGQNVKCMGASGNNVYAGTDHGMFITNDNGNTWTPINNGLKNTYVRSLVVTDSNIYVGTYGGIFFSNDNGGLWTAINNGFPYNYDTLIQAIAIKGTDIFVSLATHAGNCSSIFISSNNGGLWTTVNNGLPFNPSLGGYPVMHSMAVCGNNILAGSYYNGVFISSNDGGLWTSVNGLNDAATFAIQGNNFYASTCLGVFQSIDCGESWTLANNGLSSYQIISFAISGNNIFAGTNGNNGVFLTIDSGGVWTNVSTNGIANQAITSFAVTATNLFLGTNGTGVWKRALVEMLPIVINEANKDNSIAIYPNPASDILTLLISDKATVEITNTNGQIIKTFNQCSGETSVDISDLFTGVYTLRILTDKKIVTNKFIKE